MSKTFGEALRDFRRAAGMSQRELAKKANLDFSYISKMENDRIPPPAADTIVVICAILSIQPEELLAITGKIPSDIKADISTSKAGQEFLRVVNEMKLSESEWSKIIKSLKELRK
ncbi:MAG: helix-turn-helix domain-containing protein [Anaerolineales bacterium]|nr:helix-turn-helix domain-containing protein [Anaerolineales bacterium]